MSEFSEAAKWLPASGPSSGPAFGYDEMTQFDTRLLADLASLSATIAAARREVAALQVDDLTQREIPTATDELDAVVAHTAVATECILEVCETLDQMSSAADPGMSSMVRQALQAATTRIYEACTFQDITGQRIAKVVGALKTIDARLEGITRAFGARFPALPAIVEGSLLNGPQLPVHAMDQSDVDRLLADFA